MTLEDRMYLANNVKRVVKLLELNAPNVIIAKDVMRLILYRIARVIGPDVIAAELTAFLTKGLCLHTLRCTTCHKADSEPGNDLCEKCRREFEEWAAKIDAESEPDELDRELEAFKVDELAVVRKPGINDIAEHQYRRIAREIAKHEGRELTPDQVKDAIIGTCERIRGGLEMIGEPAPESDMEIVAIIQKNKPREDLREGGAAQEDRV